GHQTREAVVGKARRPTGDRIEIAADRDHCGGERTRQGPWVDTCGPELVERPSLPLPRIAKPRGEAQPVVDLPVKLTKEGEALGRWIGRGMGLEADERGLGTGRRHRGYEPCRRSTAIAGLPIAADYLPEIIGAHDIIERTIAVRGEAELLAELPLPVRLLGERDHGKRG